VERRRGSSGRPAGASASVLALASITLVALGLRLWRLDVGLPHVLHSDRVQVELAAELLADGSFVNRSSYPATHVYVYAAVDLVAYALGRAGLVGGIDGWPSFLVRLGDVAFRHTVARAYTALAGALLPLAVYLLARASFGRPTALVAAGIAAFDPLHVALSHQARIHVPGITLLVFAAAIVARRLASPPARGGAGSRAGDGAVAGACCGATAAVFQLGYVLLAATLAWLAARVRPARAAALCAAAALACFAAVVALVSLAGHVAGVERGSVGHVPADSVLTLGIPSATLGFHPVARMPRLLAGWVMAEPLRASFVLLYVVQVLRRRRAWDAAALGLLYAVALVVVAGTNYTHPRYALSATPFLAVPAAVVACGQRGGRSRAAAAALLLLAPLATSLRYDALLGAPHTGERAHAIVARAAEAGLRVAVQDHLMLRGVQTPPGVGAFPPGRSFRDWTTGRERPLDTLRRMDPDLLLLGPPELGGVHQPSGEQLEALGYRRAQTLSSSPAVSPSLPDATKAMAFDVWRARGLGPTITFWARDDEAAATLRRVQAAAAR
jgi:hypothetical protein